MKYVTLTLWIGGYGVVVTQNFVDIFFCLFVSFLNDKGMISKTLKFGGGNFGGNILKIHFVVCRSKKKEHCAQIVYIIILIKNQSQHANRSTC